MPKLPKNFFISILLLLIFSTSSKAMVRDSNADCWSPANLGTSNEETVILGAPTDGGFGRCDYTIPTGTSSPTLQPEKFLCAQGTRCEFNGAANPPTVLGSYLKSYFYANSTDSKITGVMKKDSTGAYVDYGGAGFDVAYTTLAQCQAAHPKRVVGFKATRSGKIPVIYATVAECVADLPPSPAPTNVCNEAKENHLFVIGGGVNLDFTPEDARTKSISITNCINNGGNASSCMDSVYNASGLTNRNFFKCTCESPLTCGLPGFSCDKTCNLNQINGYNFVETEPIRPQSPLLLIKVISNFMFYIALTIFVVNFITAGYMYIRSSGEPDKLKEATDKLTNTIGGLVFILLIGGLLNYVVGVLQSAITNL